jgi:hypothetical protein
MLPGSLVCETKHSVIIVHRLSSSPCLTLRSSDEVFVASRMMMRIIETPLLKTQADALFCSHKGVYTRMLTLLFHPAQTLNIHK